MKDSLQTPRKDDWTNEQIHFAVLAIEAAAKKMNVSPEEMQQRLKKRFLRSKTKTKINIPLSMRINLNISLPQV